MNEHTMKGWGLGGGGGKQRAGRSLNQTATVLVSGGSGREEGDGSTELS